MIYDFSQDWEVLSKNFTNINNTYINDKELTKLKLHILVTGYLEESFSRFTKVSTKDNNKVEVEAQELEPVSDFKREKKNKKSPKRAEKH